MHPFAGFLHPTSEDRATLGTRRARAYCHLRLANALVFSLALALTLARHLVPDVTASPAPDRSHWPSGTGSLTVVDRTGDPEWNQATRWAVARWNESGAGIRLRWVAGGGPCRYEGARIGVCQASSRDLGSFGRLHFEGLVEEQVAEGNHKKAAVVRVCSDCGLDPARRRVVVTHELGHVLGLAHSRRPTSVMYRAGGSDRPDAEDTAMLRRQRAHDDAR